MKSILIRTVRNQSMYPTLESGQHIIIQRARRYLPGDVIVFHHDEKEYVKRIISVEGDLFYLLGDNPRFSIDSRQFGYISKRAVVGKVIWPREAKK